MDTPRTRMAWGFAGLMAILLTMIGIATENFGMMCLPLPLVLIVYWIAR